MIARPEVAKILHDIEICTSRNTICIDKHHEQIVSTQKRFATNVQSVIITTKGQNVASAALLDTSDLEPCFYEEAGYRMMLHCFHACKLGMKNIMIHATDTDALVLIL